MRLVKLSVEGYQAIERATVELGPGLNILYGANDLGKSTLAAALRSVLLVPPTSSVAETFAPWYADATPHVTLTFMDEAKRYWRLEKRFNSSATDAATLSDSKDGISFTGDCRGRQVEEKVRAVLGWGIPAPGGKGGPKGLPSSFLATVLLGAQTDVDGILAKSLAEDPTESGKLRLTKALAVLAQDALFKQVLDAAQQEVNGYFTAKDKPKTGKESKFWAAANRVKLLQQQISGLEGELGESVAIEELIRGLRERFARSLEALTQATENLEALQLRANREQARKTARLALDGARSELARVDAHAQRVSDLSAELEALTVRVTEREADSKRAGAELDAALLALQGAEEAHRIATGEGADRDRELRRAQCAEKVANAAQHRQTVEARRDKIHAAVRARAEVEQAAQAVARARLDQEKAAREHTAAQNALQALEQQHAGWLATAAYARWRAAVEAVAELEHVTRQASDCLAEASAKDAEASSQDSVVVERMERLSLRRALLPTNDQLSALVQLEHDLQLAEAALGGGLSVEVKGRAGLTGRVALDEQPTRELVGIEVKQHLEAERRLLLSIDDVLQIEVRAGAADKRRAAEALRARRNSEILPVLERARLTSLAEITAAAAGVTAEQALVDQVRDTARALRAVAQNLRDRAADHRVHAEKLVARGDDVATRRAALGDLDLTALKASLDRLGAGAESKAEAAAAQCLGQLGPGREASAAREKASTLADFRLTEAADGEKAQQSAYSTALATLGTDDLDGLVKTVENELNAIRTEEKAHGAQLELLMAESTTEVANATSAVAAARERGRAARQACESSSTAAEAARQEQATRQGEWSALRAQLESFNREQLQASVRQRDAEVAAFGTGPDLPASALDAAKQTLDHARREQDQAKEALHHAEGKLSNAGGAALKENVARLREAHQGACDDETEVGVDAEAWKLLRDTLREVENEEGAHLGRALAGPLTAKFRDLTAGRYHTLLLNPLLRVEAVGAATTQATGPEVLAALSVGTRDQLATLIRLTIAEELGSAIVLDDHLVHSDRQRLEWFRQALSRAAVKAQVIVLTCRPQDYLTEAEMPVTASYLDLAGGSIRAIDLSRVLTRYRSLPSQSPPANNVDVIERARAS
ncbi:MAG: hypothetical protein ABI895_11440 [Deltaproteobacteria bacterium]